MRLILIVVASLVTVVLGGPHPRHNKIRRGGPFHHHGPPPPRHYAHQNLHSSAPFSHHGHGHGGGPAIGGISNYAYLAGGEGHGAHGHHHQNHHPPQLLGGGQELLSSLSQAYAPVEPPSLSVAPIIPYEPEGHFPGGGVDGGGGGGYPEPGPAPATTSISKSVYVFSAPHEPSEHIRPHIVKKFPQQKQKHYQVLFINAPNPPPHPQHTVELPPPPELKTQIYVLVKKPQPAPPVKIIPAKVPLSKPEVYFIRYKNNQGGGYAPIPSDAPITYPQVIDHGGHHGEQLIYHDQPQLLHQPHEEQFQPLVQPGLESPQEYTSIVPVQEHEHQLEYAPHHHQQLQQFQPGPEEYVVGPQEGQYGEYVEGGGVVGGVQEQYAPATVGDPYSDYSRLSAHFSTVTGRPVKLLSSRLWNKKKSTKLRRRKNPVSRSDANNEKWTPIIAKNKVGKRELDAGMSGI